MRDQPLRFHYTLVLALRAALGTLRSGPRLERVASAPISPGQTRSFLVGQRSPLQPSPQSGHGKPKTRAVLADAHLIAAAVSATAAVGEVVGEITAHELRHNPATILLNYVAKGLVGNPGTIQRLQELLIADMSIADCGADTLVRKLCLTALAERNANADT